MCCRLWKWEVSYSFCFFFASSWVTMHLSQRPARSLGGKPTASAFLTYSCQGGKISSCPPHGEACAPSPSPSVGERRCDPWSPALPLPTPTSSPASISLGKLLCPCPGSPALPAAQQEPKKKRFACYSPLLGRQQTPNSPPRRVRSPPPPGTLLKNEAYLFSNTFTLSLRTFCCSLNWWFLANSSSIL